MSAWLPSLDHRSSTHLYQQIIDHLINDIQNNHLHHGDKLPTVRALANALHVTPGTINKAFSVAQTKGLVQKTQGKGTFVTAKHLQRHFPVTMVNGRTNAYDFTINEPVHMDVCQPFNAALSDVAQQNDERMWTQYGDTRGVISHREDIAQWLNTRGAQCNAEHLFLTSGAQQGLISALMLLCSKGDTVMVQETTFPGEKAIASMLGLTLHPIRMNSAGMDLEHFEFACKTTLSRVIIMLPTAHNPTGMTMSLEQREQLIAIARKYKVLIIEDDLYLHDSPIIALQQLAPERTFHISGFSKCIAPALRVGTLITPVDYVDTMTRVIQAQNWMTAPLLTNIASYLWRSGELESIIHARCHENKQRTALCQRILNKLPLAFNAANLHVWVRHSSRVENAEIIARLGQKGVDVLPSAFFHAAGHSSPHIRLCIGKHDLQGLTNGLNIIAQELAPTIMERPII
jgi:DNA-binding transcriptional MocR family regulator